MGSYRSPARRRAEDQGMLDHESCPVLAANEWVRYWKRLPHSALMRTLAAVAPVRLNADGEAKMGEGDSGSIVNLRRVYGIVDWCLFDENGNPVPWDRAQGEALLDGLDEAVLDALDDRIGAGDLPLLGAPADPANPDGPNVGEASAES